MSDTDIWSVIAVLVVATAATRSALWLLGHRITIPPRMQEVLRYAPACALAAIIAPDLLLGNTGQLQLALSNPKLLAGSAAVVFYLLRRNMLLTILFGMLVFSALRVFAPFGVTATSVSENGVRWRAPSLIFAMQPAKKNADPGFALLPINPLRGLVQLR